MLCFVFDFYIYDFYVYKKFYFIAGKYNRHRGGFFRFNKKKRKKKFFNILFDEVKVAEIKFMPSWPCHTTT